MEQFWKLPMLVSSNKKGVVLLTGMNARQSSLFLVKGERVTHRYIWDTHPLVPSPSPLMAILPTPRRLSPTSSFTKEGAGLVDPAGIRL